MGKRDLPAVAAASVVMLGGCCAVLTTVKPVQDAAAAAVRTLRNGGQALHTTSCQILGRLGMPR